MLFIELDFTYLWALCRAETDFRYDAQLVLGKGGVGALKLSTIWNMENVQCRNSAISFGGLDPEVWAVRHSWAVNRFHFICH
jgi:hypothetical protein